MASKEEILGILAGESGPMNRTAMGKKLGLPTSSFQNQLDRLEKQEMVETNERDEYTITEAGRQFALAAPPPPPEETPPGEETEESLKTTEFQQFMEFGKGHGVVPLALLTQTANHIWRGGDFRDLTWVWKGLTEMGIRSDLAQRWFHSWRSYLHQAIPPALVSVTSSQIAEGGTPAKEAEEVGKGKRDYILDASALPLYVGEGVGDLDKDEAVRLSALRQAVLARGGPQATAGGQPATPGSMADEVVKIFNAFKETMGPQTHGKSYIVKPGEDGYAIEEVEEGKPTIISAPGQGNTNPASSYLIDAEGNVTEVTPGKPVVIKQAAPPASQPGKTVIVRQTPEGIVTEEYEAGKPIIISAPTSLGSNTPPMLMPAFNQDGEQMKDDKGNPIYGPAEQMMKWWEFWNKQKREDERHSMFMGIGQQVRENVPDGIRAILEATQEAREERKAGTEAEPPTPPQQQAFKCGDCGTQFSAPPEWAGQNIKCPNPNCPREYTKEELLP